MIYYYYYNSNPLSALAWFIIYQYMYFHMNSQKSMLDVISQKKIMKPIKE